MHKRFRRVAVFASVAALAGGAVAGCGSQAATTNGTAQQQQQGQPPGSSDDMAAALAKELGVSESKVKAALEKVRPQGGPPNGQAAPSGTPTNSTSS